LVGFAFASLLLMRSAASSPLATSQVVPLNPTKTFLAADGDDPTSAPVIVDLQQIGVAVGSTINLKAYGNFLWNPGQGLQGTGAVAIFSSTNQVLPQSNRHRVPGAIASGAQPYVTAPTFGGTATDVPEDFLLGDAVVTVPTGAQYLMLGADDVFWSDNIDPEVDFEIVASLATACGYALNLDGTNDQVISLSNFDLSQLTVEGWSWLQSGTQYCCGYGGGLVAYGHDGDSAWEVRYESPTLNEGGLDHSQLTGQVNWNKPSSAWTFPSPALMGDSGWRHWAFTYDGVTARLYVDGQLLESVQWNLAISAGGPGAYLAIGNDFPGGDEYLGGLIDEIRIWDYARTEAEIRGTMSSPLTGNELGLYAYYSFDEGTGQIVHDDSGHGRDAYLGGSTSPDGSDPTWVASTAPLGCPWSYGAVEGAIDGVDGKPFLHGTGTLVAGSPGSIALHYAVPSAFAMLFVSAPTGGLTPAPFKGGTLWALPIALKLPLMTSPAGSVVLNFASWPGGLPSGLLIAMQCAVADPAAVYGVALSNLLLAETP
jgi:hypothetical protein